MKEIQIKINNSWKNFKHNLDKNQQKKLFEKITFKYDYNTTVYDLFMHLNIIYKDIILKFENNNENKLNYKRIIRERYRIVNKKSLIYIYDLDSKVSTLINIFKLDQITIFFTFFGELGGRLLELNGMQFYMHSKEKGKHNIPHMHVKYQGEEVVISLDGKILAGKIKDKKQKLAADIISGDRESLLLKWNSITDGEKFCFNKSELIRII